MLQKGRWQKRRGHAEPCWAGQLTERLLGTNGPASQLVQLGKGLGQGRQLVAHDLVLHFLAVLQGQHSAQRNGELGKAQVVSIVGSPWPLHLLAVRQ